MTRKITIYDIGAYQYPYHLGVVPASLSSIHDGGPTAGKMTLFFTT